MGFDFFCCIQRTEQQSTHTKVTTLTSQSYLSTQFKEARRADTFPAHYPYRWDRLVLHDVRLGYNELHVVIGIEVQITPATTIHFISRTEGFTDLHHVVFVTGHVQHQGDFLASLSNRHFPFGILEETTDNSRTIPSTITAIAEVDIQEGITGVRNINRVRLTTQQNQRTINHHRGVVLVDVFNVDSTSFNTAQGNHFCPVSWVERTRSSIAGSHVELVIVQDKFIQHITSCLGELGDETYTRLYFGPLSGVPRTWVNQLIAEIDFVVLKNKEVFTERISLVKRGYLALNFVRAICQPNNPWHRFWIVIWMPMQPVKFLV